MRLDVCRCVSDAATCAVNHKKYELVELTAAIIILFACHAESCLVLEEAELMLEVSTVTGRLPFTGACRAMRVSNRSNSLVMWKRCSLCRLTSRKALNEQSHRTSPRLPAATKARMCSKTPGGNLPGERLMRADSAFP